MILSLLNTNKEFLQPHENDLKYYVLVHLQIVGYANTRRCMTLFDLHKARSQINYLLTYKVTTIY